MKNLPIPHDQNYHNQTHQPPPTFANPRCDNLVQPESGGNKSGSDKKKLFV